MLPVSHIDTTDARVEPARDRLAEVS